MLWTIYLIVAVAVAMTAFVASNWIRTPDIIAPDYPGTLSVVAGAMWPVMIIGVTELALAAWLIPARRTH